MSHNSISFRNRKKAIWITKPSTRNLLDDYDIINQIGDGMSATTYKCQRKSDKLFFALKKIDKSRIYRYDATDPLRVTFIKSLKSEVKIMKKLKHRSIIQLIDTYETKNTLYIVMELCNAGELFDMINKKGRFNENECKHIIKQILEGIFYCHEQHSVIHRDLKPDNILLTNDNNIKIIDFGMSDIIPRLRSCKKLWGSPYYTAPEVIKGDYNNSCDMWSIGVITFVMLFGFPPFYVDDTKYTGNEETQQIYKRILNGFIPKIQSGFGPWFPQLFCGDLSSKCLDFMSKLLVNDVSKRMTAKEALQHEWFVDDELNDDMDLLGLQLLNFAKAKPFKYIISALLSNEYRQNNKKHVRHLKKLFASFTNQHDTRLYYNEFKQILLVRCSKLKLNENQIKTIFNAIDINNNGYIEFDQFLNVIIFDYIISSDTRLFESYNYLINDEVDCIDIKELKSKVRKLNICKKKLLKKFINDIDLDCDGYIDYEEFIRSIHPDFQDRTFHIVSSNDLCIIYRAGL